VKFNKISSIQIEMLFASRKIDISVFHKKNSCKMYSNYINETLMNYPQIKPIFFVIKKISETFNLHNSLINGLKTYSLFLMIYYVIKTHPHKNLG
jgi:DNA polymerase sigma